MHYLCRWILENDVGVFRIWTVIVASVSAYC